MKVFRWRAFDLLELKLGPGVYADYEFNRCSFNYAPFAFPHRPEDRAAVRNIKLIDCDVRKRVINGSVPAIRQLRIGGCSEGERIA